jgi:hypothetical protein
VERGFAAGSFGASLYGSRFKRYVKRPVTDAKEVRVGNPAGRNVPSPDDVILKKGFEACKTFFQIIFPTKQSLVLFSN